MNIILKHPKDCEPYFSEDDFRITSPHSGETLLVRCCNVPDIILRAITALKEAENEVKAYIWFGGIALGIDPIRGYYVYVTHALHGMKYAFYEGSQNWEITTEEDY